MPVGSTGTVARSCSGAGGRGEGWGLGWAALGGVDPPDRCCPDTTDDHTLLWLLNHIRLGIPELIVQVRHHKHTRVYAFFVTATYER